MSYVDVFITYVVPKLPVLVGGVGIGGIASLWIKWGIEKQRMRIERRQKLVDAWRTVLLPKMEDAQALEKGTRKYPFMRTPEYASLRSHLPPKLVAMIEDSAIHINMRQNDGHITDVIGDFPRKQILEEIARIERKWKLV